MRLNLPVYAPRKRRSAFPGRRQTQIVGAGTARRWITRNIAGRMRGGSGFCARALAPRPRSDTGFAPAAAGGGTLPGSAPATASAPANHHQRAGTIFMILHLSAFALAGGGGLSSIVSLGYVADASAHAI